ncbi:hypothetical protein QDY71_10360 [Kingella negevensis]|nr:hypothetical protein [Kingella negevensis]MDK4698142.1 hypothetical protein [Kingella negevensis]
MVFRQPENAKILFFKKHGICDMPILDWNNKADAIKAASKSPYRLLIENAEYSYGTASQPVIQKI